MNVEPFMAQWTRLPEEGDLATDLSLDLLSFDGLDNSAVSEPHQPRNLVAVIDDALSADFGRMRRQDRNCERPSGEVEHRVLPDAGLFKLGQHLIQGCTRFSGDALPVFGKIGQQGEQHEASGEGQGLVQRQ